jgi:mannan endo-1,4-beta-mannosidase
MARSHDSTDADDGSHTQPTGTPRDERPARHRTRRSLLEALGTISLATLAGCSSLPGSGDSTASPGTPGPRMTGAGGEATGTNDGSTAETMTAAPDPEPRSGRTLTGLANDATAESLAELGAYERWATQRPATVVTFVNGLESADQVDWYLTERLTPLWERGHVPIVTWMPANTNPPENSAPTVDRQIANGGFDSLIETWARRLETWALGPDGEREIPRRFYFRPGHEMNGNWFPWSATQTPTTAEDYVRMWRRLYGIFGRTALDETTMQWVFSPNADEVGDVDVEAYYPGDEYVDWFGLDGFNFGDSEPWSDWVVPQDIFGGMLERVRALADKPVALTEFATTSYYRGRHRPERKADWVDEAFSMVEAEDIAMACWFDVDKEGTDESDWAVFGGQRGTGSYTDPETDTRYPVYGNYKEVMNAGGMLSARSEYPRVLTDSEFAGRF